jgi:hypothetical protein
MLILTRGSCLFGGCICHMNSLMGVVPMLVFYVSWYDEIMDNKH